MVKNNVNTLDYKEISEKIDVEIKIDNDNYNDSEEETSFYIHNNKETIVSYIARIMVLDEMLKEKEFYVSSDISFTYFDEIIKTDPVYGGKTLIDVNRTTLTPYVKYDGFIDDEFVLVDHPKFLDKLPETLMDAINYFEANKESCTKKAKFDLNLAGLVIDSAPTLYELVEFIKEGIDAGW